MLFNSYLFIFAFLPIMFVIYFLLLKQRLILGSKIWLIAGSIFFYGYWNMIYIPLLLFSIFTNFYIGKSLSYINFTLLSKKALLWVGIVFNIALLGYFKYTDFFIKNFNFISSADIPLQNIVLPLGISFFTFTQIAFLVDAYKKDVVEVNILNYMLFVTYFPHLLAGPILHHKEMMPQFANKINFVIKWRHFYIGLLVFAIGLFKKVAIADTFAKWANIGFDASTTLNFFEAWVTSLSYTFQLYFDFSGYTDMAIGVSLMLNIKLPINFNSPYKALDIQNFWHRWHMTLSRFLRDYIYIPLGGNRVPQLQNYFNLFFVFFVGGIWHGASWMFVIWGTMHGCAIVIHRIWKNLGFNMNNILAWILTFNFINITWIFFRSHDMENATKILSGMLGLNGVVLPEVLRNKLQFLANDYISFGGVIARIDSSFVFVFAYILLGFVITLAFNNSNYIYKVNKKISLLVFASVAFATSVVMLSAPSEFLYFRF